MHPFSAQIVAQKFMDHIYKLHGMPRYIISDRDPIFTSCFWQHLFKLTGNELFLSTTRHPQTDGQTERVNQCLKTFLRCYTQASPNQWSKWLSLAEFWYNTIYHSSLGKSPFAVLYGREPRQLGMIKGDVDQPMDVRAWLKERKLMLELVKQHLHCAQQQMKTQADKKQSDRSFQPGDKVFLKLQPYVQTSVAQRASHKLAFKFYGPFLVLAKVGAVAYRLQLPEGSLVHPVFHVSQLKEAKMRPTPASGPLPANTFDFQVPLAILGYKWRKTPNKMVRQGRVQWTGAPPGDATWEDLDDLHRRFPCAPAWVPLCILRVRDKDIGRRTLRQGLTHWSYSSADKAKWEDTTVFADSSRMHRLGDKPFFKERGLSAALLRLPREPRPSPTMLEMGARPRTGPGGRDKPM